MRTCNMNPRMAIVGAAAAAVLAGAASAAVIDPFTSNSGSGAYSGGAFATRSKYGVTIDSAAHTAAFPYSSSYDGSEIDYFTSSPTTGLDWSSFSSISFHYAYNGTSSFKVNLLIGSPDAVGDGSGESFTTVYNKTFSGSSGTATINKSDFGAWYSSATGDYGAGVDYATDYADGLVEPGTASWNSVQLFRFLITPEIGKTVTIDSFNVNFTPVPAPGAIALLGVAGVVGARRRR